MYVAPTPFVLTDGTTGQRTLILPKSMSDARLEPVGELTRVECEKLVVGYSFDLRTNVLTPQYIDNSSAGATHQFVAYRPKGVNGPEVSMKNYLAGEFR